MICQTVDKGIPCGELGYLHWKYKPTGSILSICAYHSDKMRWLHDWVPAKYKCRRS